MRRLFAAAWWLAVACCAGVPAAHALEAPANAGLNERNTPVISQAMPAALPEVAAGAAKAAQDAVSQAQSQASAAATPPAASAPAAALQEQGGASWYARHFQGRRTANGERYDQNELTAAHKTLPFGTVVRVRSEVDGQEVDVRINDRGPFVAGRVIDLSQAAAKALGMLQNGVRRVTLLLPPSLRPPEWSSDKRPGTNLGNQTADAPLSVPQDAPSARAFNPAIQ